MNKQIIWLLLACIGVLFFSGYVIQMSTHNEDTWTPTDRSEQCFVRTYSDNIHTLYCVMDSK